MLPVIKELMSSGISVWLYSGDTDGAVPVTTTRYAIDYLQTSVKTPWYPWYTQAEVQTLNKPHTDIHTHKSSEMFNH